MVGDKKKTSQSAVCGFNKKPYDDMKHFLMLYEKPVQEN
jgi:hypothetical protein